MKNFETLTSNELTNVNAGGATIGFFCPEP